MLRPLQLTTFLLGASLLAQTPACESTNDANNNIVTTITAAALSGPVSWGYRITAANTNVLMSMQILTGNTAITPGFMALEIFDNDPATSLPGNRLGGGTWRIAPNLGIEWQGTNLDQLVPIAQGADYWIVWTEPGGSRLPYEPGGVTLPFARRMTNAAWLAQTTPQALKWRGFCGLLDSQNVSNVGLGCPSSSGRIATSFTNQQPAVGNADFRIEGSSLPPGSLAVFVVGWDPNFMSVPVPGLGAACFQHTDALSTSIVLTGTGNARANAVTTAGISGHAIFEFPIPAAAGLAGVFFSTQIAAYDPALTTPLPFATTNGVRFTIL